MKRILLSMVCCTMLTGTLFSQPECQPVQIIVNNATNGTALGWSIIDQNQNAVIYGGNYFNGTTVTIPYCLPPGCYTLVMTDLANDGWGNGNIMVTSNGAVLVNTTLASGDYGTFTFGINSPNCQNSIISGCMDPAATNYNAQAVVDDGTCIYPSLCPNGGTPGNFYLCTFSNGANVAIQIVSDEGMILFEQHGFANGTIMNIPVCVDEDACYTVHMWNLAGETGWYGGYWWLNVEGNQLATNSLDNNLIQEYANFSMDNSCTPLVIEGCTNPVATNYNQQATIDDGSCILPECNETLVSISVTPGGFANEIQWNITGTNGYSINGGAPFNAVLCLPDDCYTITLNDSYGDGWNGAQMIVATNGAVAFAGTVNSGYGALGSFGINTEGCVPEQPNVYGCTDQNALNYNPAANIDDNSCQYPANCDGLVPANLYLCAFGNASELALEIVAEDGTVIFSQQGFNDLQILNITVCIDPTQCYTATMSNLAGNAGWYGGYWWLNAGNTQLVTNESLNGNSITETITFGLGGSCNGGNIDVYGCTDPQALNYNYLATIDDGSCEFTTDCNAYFEVIQDTTGQNIFWIVTNYLNSGTVYNYIWDFGDGFGTISNLPFPTFTYTENGEYVLCLTIIQVSPNGSITCTETFCVTLNSAVFESAGGGGIQSAQGFTINVVDASQLELGIGENTSDNNLNIYPNPASDIISISASQSATGVVSLQILDMSGKLIVEKQLNTFHKGQVVQLNVAELSAGVYMIRMIDGQRVNTLRFIKR